MLSPYKSVSTQYFQNNYFIKREHESDVKCPLFSSRLASGEISFEIDSTRRKISMTAMLQALKIVLIVFGVGVQCQTEYEDRDGKDMSISEHRQCYVFGQCQV